MGWHCSDKYCIKIIMKELKIKSFSSSTDYELAEKIETWLNENDVEYIDLKYSMTYQNQYAQHYSALLIYKNK